MANGVTIFAPEPSTEPAAVAVRVHLRNTADARVTAANCLTTPSSNFPTAYCYMDITATVPEPPSSLALMLGLLLLFVLGRWKHQ